MCKIDFKQHFRQKDSGVRKRLFLIGLLPAGIGWGYLFYLSWAIGFAISKYCGGKKDGRAGRVRSIIIPCCRYELHLHHWFVAFLAGAISATSGFFLVAPELFYGFLSGLAFQGIYCYGDWHRIVKRKSKIGLSTSISRLCLSLPLILYGSQDAANSWPVF